MKLFYLLFILCFAVLSAYAGIDDPLKNDTDYKSAQTFIKKHWQKTSSAIDTVQAVTKELQTITEPHKALMWSYALRRLVANGEGVGGISKHEATPAEEEVLLKAIRVGEVTHGLVNGWYDYHLCTRTHRKVYGAEEVLPGAYSALSAAQLNDQMKQNESFSTHLTQVYAYARSVQLQLIDTGQQKTDIPLLILFSAAAPEMPIQIGLNFRKTLNGEPIKAPVNFKDSLTVSLTSLLPEVQSLSLYKSIQSRMEFDLSKRLKFKHKSYDDNKDELRYLMWVPPNGSCQWYAEMLMAGVYGYYEPYDLLEHYRNSFFFFPWRKKKGSFDALYRRGGFQAYKCYNEASGSEQESEFNSSIFEDCFFLGDIRSEFNKKLRSPSIMQHIPPQIDHDLLESFNIYELLDLPKDNRMKAILNKYSPLSIFYNMLSLAMTTLKASPLNSRDFDFTPFFLFNGKDAWEYSPKMEFLKWHSSNEHGDLALSSQRPKDEEKKLFYLLSWTRAKAHEDKRNGGVTHGYLNSWRPELVKEYKGAN